jgi:very-short-patch-repair endonuclease
VIGHSEVATRAELLAAGVSRRGLARALASGSVIRVRRDRYMVAESPQELREAVRIGGRATCLTLLHLVGVFVFASDRLHVHISRGMSRLRSAADVRRPLEHRSSRRQRLHWVPLVRPDDVTGACVGLVDALVHAVLCQPARHAIATIDSALNKRLIGLADLADVFAALPPRFRVLRSLVDGRAQSGPETLVRLMARALGCRVDVQVFFDGVGFVDLLLDGWLVVECDSKEFHQSWEQQVKDRNRDLALAAQGFVTLRLTAAQIMYRPDEVVSALRCLVRTHRGCAPR